MARKPRGTIDRLGDRLEWGAAFWFLLPALIGYGVFWVFPAARAIWFSLTDATLLRDGKFVGLGRIGTATALRAKAFGMTVIAYDPYVSRGTEIAVGVDRVETLEALLEVSDTVSLHCPLTDETRGMIDAAALRRMKRAAVLINTARGGIVDVPALLEALRDGVIAGAGIDVLPVEPPEADGALALAYRAGADPIVGERLLVTPHAAWSSPESVNDARRLSVETALLYLRAGALRNLVNRPGINGWRKA